MHVKDIIVLSEAADDLKNGKTFYEQLEAGVGDYFWDSLVSDIESLFLYAGIHNKKFGFHRMLSKRFPYAIYYQIEGNIAQIIAILPIRRDPAWIKGRLEVGN